MLCRRHADTLATDVVHRRRGRMQQLAEMKDTNGSISIMSILFSPNIYEIRLNRCGPAIVASWNETGMGKHRVYLATVDFFCFAFKHLHTRRDTNRAD